MNDQPADAIRPNLPVQAPAPPVAVPGGEGEGKSVEKGRGRLFSLEWMTETRLVIAVVVIVLGVIAIWLSGGYDSTPPLPRVRLQHFSNVTNGMSYQEVCRVVGFDGVLSHSMDGGQLFNAKYYDWANTPDSFMRIAFDNDDKVIFKYQQNLR